MTTPNDYFGMRPTTEPVAPYRPRRCEPASFDEVLAAAMQGDSWAFDRLFAELSGPLRAFAVARGADDADGLVNEVLAEIFTDLPRFSGDEGAFRGFVFHVARRRLIDDYRRRSRRPAISSHAPPERHAPEGDQPHQLGGLSLERTVAALAQLTDDQRDVLLLRVVCDLSLAATAAAIDKPVTAVKALQRRGIASLQRRISDGTVSL